MTFLEMQEKGRASEEGGVIVCESFLTTCFLGGGCFVFYPVPIRLLFRLWRESVNAGTLA